jgi:hypothetical protein
MVGGKLGVKTFFNLCYLEFLIIIIFLIENKCNFCYKVKERPSRGMKIQGPGWPIESRVCRLDFKV